MIVKLIVLIFIFPLYLYSMHVDHKVASKLASDAYLKKQEFANIYKNNYTEIKTGKTLGVRYFVIEDTDNTIIVIRGTANIRNVITDVMAIEDTFLNDETVQVHKGFYDVAKKIVQVIKFDTKKDVVIVGHSLGGAVSLLYGAMLKEKGIENLTLFTFGMPPVVNKAFLDKYKTLKHYRHFHIFDPVPTLSKPTIQLFETQKKFKAFLSSQDTISNMISTIQNIPDKYRHHGITNTIKNRLEITKEKLENSLFFKTCTLYFDYHKIDNYIKALQGLNEEYIKIEKDKIVYQSKNKPLQTKYIKVIPSTLKGTVPLEVEFYIDSEGVDIGLYYFNFGGSEVLKQSLSNNKISHTFTKSGKHTVKIALKDDKNNIVETSFVINTRKATFQEYQDAIGKEFDQFKDKY